MVQSRLTGKKTTQCAKFKVSLASKKFNTLGEDKMQEPKNPINSLAHTKWNCKYHTYSICTKIQKESVF